MRLPIAVLACAVAGFPLWEPIHAAEDAVAPVRSPGDLSEAERVQMMQSANRYHACLYEQALAEIDADDDIRAIADLAMGHCQPQLDQLEAMISGWGIDRNFAAGFARSMRDRGARRLLPELAVEKSR